MGGSYLERARFHYRAWRYRLQVESAEIAFVRQSLSKGDTCVDLGGHKGAFSYWMAHGVGRQGRVYTFEPQPELAEYLQRVMTPYPQVQVVHAAVSDRPGVVQLSRESDSPSPGATLEANSESGLWRCPVKAETLTTFFQTHPGRPVAFLKCDVEGHELAAFRGAREILLQDQPTLLFECEQRHCRNRPMTEVFEFLQGLGYRGEFFCGGVLHPLEEFEPETNGPHQSDYINNFVFRIPDRAGVDRSAAGPRLRKAS